jgi:hypothetical protein
MLHLREINLSKVNSNNILFYTNSPLDGAPKIIVFELENYIIAYSRPNYLSSDHIVAAISIRM